MMCLTVDLGGTVWKAGVVQEGRILRTATAPAKSQDGLGPHLPRLAAFLRELAGEAGVPLHQCAGLAACIPGLVDAASNRVVSANTDKYADAHTLDLLAWSRDTLGLPFRLENDAHAACLGEWKCGAGRGCEDLVMMTLGTGIGVSVVIRGRALRGKHAQAGVLGGHFVVTPQGRPCGCGGRGCIEAETGSAALPELARSDARFAASQLSCEAVIDYATVFRLAAAGDPLAVALRQRSLDYWAAHCVSLIHAFDPERLIIGGGILKSAEVILPHLQAWTDARAWTPWGKVQILPATLGNDAALLGLYALLSQPVEYL